MQKIEPIFYVQYGTVLAIIMNTAIFATIAPICYIFSFTGLAIYFILQKIFYHKRYSRPNSLS